MVENSFMVETTPPLPRTHQSSNLFSNRKNNTYNNQKSSLPVICNYASSLKKTLSANSTSSSLPSDSTVSTSSFTTNLSFSSANSLSNSLSPAAKRRDRKMAFPAGHDMFKFGYTDMPAPPISQRPDVGYSPIMAGSNRSLGFAINSQESTSSSSHRSSPRSVTRKLVVHKSQVEKKISEAKEKRAKLEEELEAETELIEKLAAVRERGLSFNEWDEEDELKLVFDKNDYAASPTFSKIGETILIKNHSKMVYLKNTYNGTQFTMRITVRERPRAASEAIEPCRRRRKYEPLTLSTQFFSLGAGQRRRFFVVWISTKRGKRTKGPKRKRSESKRLGRRAEIAQAHQPDQRNPRFSRCPSSD